MKSASSRFAVFMISSAVMMFAGLGVWAYTQDFLKEYLLILGGLILVYLFMVGMFTWIERGE